MATSTATSDLQRIAAFLKRPEPVKWLFAGDSIAQGALHTMGCRDYSELYCERVRWELNRRRDCVIKTAISGWKVGNLLDDIEWSVLQHRADVVCIGVGMNDCAEGPEQRDGFRQRYRKLIGQIRDHSEVAIVLQTPNRITPADALRFGHLPDYTAAIRDVAESEKAALVDHFAAWEAAEKAQTINYWLSDPCHPNECGHRAMANEIFRALGIFDPSESRVCRLFVP
jgi:lysophospholipase L1-like esterase